MGEAPQAYPLHWPLAQKRTRRRERSRFASTTVHRECSDLADELNRLCASHVVVSTNIQLRIDGQPYSNRRPPEDPGVAVYFRLRGESMVLACDRWDRVAHNIRAIAKHIEAMRGMERWGVGSQEQAFAGYRALPETASEPSWWSELGLQEQPTTLERARAAYRTACKVVHPDAGGTDEEFQRVQRAWERAREALEMTAEEDFSHQLSEMD